MADFVRRHPLIAYFVLAYAGSWLVWAFYVLSLDGLALLPFHAPASYLIIIGLGTFTGPAIAAFTVTALTEGRAGVDRLAARVVHWRVGFAWYLFAFLALPAIETLGSIAMPGVLASFTPIDWLPELLAMTVFFIYPALLAGPLGEEIGWRGVALPKLQALYGPMQASLMLGLLWAFWHAPIWLSGQWSQPTPLNIATYVFWITAVTFIFTWVFNNTGGSVLMAILLHGTMDVFPNMLLLPHLPAVGEMTSGGVLTMYLGLALGFGLTALVLIIATRGRLGRPAA